MLVIKTIIKYILIHAYIHILKTVPKLVFSFNDCTMKYIVRRYVFHYILIKIK